MEALKHLVANIPDWLKRLEEIDYKVAKRQKALARRARNQGYLRLWSSFFRVCFRLIAAGLAVCVVI